MTPEEYTKRLTDIIFEFEVLFCCGYQYMSDMLKQEIAKVAADGQR